MPSKWEPDEFTGRRFGAYEVLCRLALGGMAEIFLGFGHVGPWAGVPVVLKRIVDSCRDDPEALSMIVNEAKLTATLSHGNIAQIIDLVAEGDDVVLVIEFIPGVNLEEFVERFSATGEPVPLGLAVAVVAEVAAGLERAHLHRDSDGSPRPIVHRDVTPRNVMLGFDGVTKLLDFGIARAAGAERHTLAGVVRGRTTYMSPEQVVGQEVDARTDLFSLGVIFHELLVGAPLFRRDTTEDEMEAVWGLPIPPPSSVSPRVPKALDAVVLRALERPLERRYASASELLRDLAFAAGASAWQRPKCAELLRERFAEERAAILRCLDRVPADLAQLASDRSAAPPLLLGPGALGAEADEGSDATSPAELSPYLAGAVLPAAESLGGRGAGPLATTGPGPTAVMAPRPLAAEPRTLMAGGLPWVEDGADGAAAPASGAGPVPSTGLTRPLFPQAAFPSTNAATPALGRAARRWWVGAAALVLLLGLVGGATFQKLRARRADEGARCRLSLAADRPAAIFLDGRYLGRAPLEGVELSAGRRTFYLVEADGAQRAVDLDLKAGIHSKAKLALDTLPLVP